MFKRNPKGSHTSAADAWAAGNPEAVIKLGFLANTAGDLDAARAWWGKAAKLGDPEAASSLAELDASNN